MYEKQRKLWKHCANCIRSAFAQYGSRFVVALACALSLLSGCVVRYSVLSYEVDTNPRASPDTCRVEVWRRYFPRRITKFRVLSPQKNSRDSISLANHPKDKRLQDTECGHLHTYENFATSAK